ncbi:hypothetical protein WAI453_002417 [Rhynchosporium graminicola]
MATNTIDLVFQRLSDPSTDVKLKVEAACQLRDSLEHYISGNIYGPFLKKLVPIFITILKGPPVFISTSNEQVSFLVLCGMMAGY